MHMWCDVVALDIGSSTDAQQAAQVEPWKGLMRAHVHPRIVTWSWRTRLAPSHLALPKINRDNHISTLSHPSNPLRQPTPCDFASSNVPEPPREC